jgi:hypothetical protein
MSTAMIHELEAIIIAKIAKLLRCPADTLLPKTSLAAVGLDSLRRRQEIAFTTLLSG